MTSLVNHSSATLSSDAKHKICLREGNLIRIMPVMGSRSKFKTARWLTILLACLISLMIILWLQLAPPGVSGKLWAIGYSVCHQMTSHSYIINGMQLPLCSRCTGLFLGALITLAILGSQERRSGFPPRAMRWILLTFVLAYGVDGINSTLATFSSEAALYEPTALARLVTGTLMGIALGSLVMTLWNQIPWQDSDPQPLLNSYRLLGTCLAGGVLVDVLVPAGIPFLYYPLAILSSGSVVLLIAMVYTLLWTLVLKRENALVKWQQAPWIFLLGGISAMAQIATLDLVRFAITHSWAGFAV